MSPSCADSTGVNAVERLRVKLARIPIFVPRHPRFRLGQIEDVNAYQYMRDVPGTASEVPLDQRSATPASTGRIKRVVEVKDTREWDDNVEPPKPIPGSGDARQCDRCGRMHEVHVIVELEDGGEAVIGQGCARKDEMEVVRKAVSSAKTVDRLEHQLVKAQARLQAANEAWAKVQAMEPPEIENLGRGAIGTEWAMGDAHMYQRDEGPITEERKSSLIDSWRTNRQRELGAEEPYKPAVLVEDLEKRLKRARKAQEKQKEIELARIWVAPYLRPGDQGIERVRGHWWSYDPGEGLLPSPGAPMPSRRAPEPPVPPTTPSVASEVPPLPGETPIPEGHVRLFHITPLRNAATIRADGLTMATARGESYGEPNLIWGSAGVNSEQAKRVTEGGLMDSDFAVIEFHADPNDLDIGSGRTPESLEGRSSDVTMRGDVSPSNIVAVHEPWHSAYRYLSEYRPQVVAGEYDFAGEDNENYARALELIKQEEAATPSAGLSPETREAMEREIARFKKEGMEPAPEPTPEPLPEPTPSAPWAVRIQRVPDDITMWHPDIFNAARRMYEQPGHEAGFEQFKLDYRNQLLALPIRGTEAKDYTYNSTAYTDEQLRELYDRAHAPDQQPGWSPTPLYGFAFLPGKKPKGMPEELWVDRLRWRSAVQLLTEPNARGDVVVLDDNEPKVVKYKSLQRIPNGMRLPDDQSTGRVQALVSDPERGRIYAVVSDDGDPETEDTQVVAEATRRLKQMIELNRKMEDDLGLRNKWNGVLKIGLPSRELKKGADAAKHWGCSIAIDVEWFRAASTERMEPDVEQLLVHELAHGMSGAAGSKRFAYMGNAALEEGVAEGYTTALLQVQRNGPDSLAYRGGMRDELEGLSSAGYAKWVEGLEYVFLDSTADEAHPRGRDPSGQHTTAGERLEFFRGLIKTTLQGRERKVKAMSRQAGWNTWFDGNGLGSEMKFQRVRVDPAARERPRRRFVEGVEVAADRSSVHDMIYTAETPDDARAIYPEVQEYLASGPPDAMLVARDAEGLVHLGTADGLPLDEPLPAGEPTTDHPKTMYHLTSSSLRASIERDGLDSTKALEGFGRGSDPGRNYLYDRLVDTQNVSDRTDVWEVDTEGLPLIPDERLADVGGHAWYGDAIPPGRLRLKEKGIPPPPSPVVEDWRMEHQPDPEGTPASDLTEGGFIPADFYEHPEWYASTDTGDPEADRATSQSLDAIFRLRGHPNRFVTIYRSSPKGTRIGEGDWVSLSPTYARMSGKHPDDPSKDMPVHKKTVHARDVRWDGNDVNEFGYFPHEAVPREPVPPPPPSISVPADAAEVGTEPGVNGVLRQPSGSPVRGTVIRPDDPRIPEVVYHVTTDLPAVQESGVVRVGGAGGLGGDQRDQIVSMTINRDIADRLAEDIRLNATVMKLDGQSAYEYLEQVADREGWGASWRNQPFVAGGRVAEWTQYGPHDILIQFFSARNTATGKTNPLFFGTEGAGVDPEKVGVVEIRREDLDNGALLTDFDLGKGYLEEIRSYGDVRIKKDESVRSWEGFPFDERAQEAPRPGDIAPERAKSVNEPNGNFVFYHGTSPEAAERIALEGRLLPDDLSTVGVSTTPEDARVYGVMKSGPDAAVLRIEVSPSNLSEVVAGHEVGGRGRNQFLLKNKERMKPWPGVTVEATDFPMDEPPGTPPLRYTDGTEIELTSDQVSRGIVATPTTDIPRDLAERLVDGSATAEDVLSLIDTESVGGYWAGGTSSWYSGPELGSIGFSQMYAYVERGESVAQALREQPHDPVMAQVGVILVGEKPSGWDPDENAYIDRDTDIPLSTIYYDAGNGFRALPAEGTSVHIEGPVVDEPLQLRSVEATPKEAVHLKRSWRPIFELAQQYDTFDDFRHDWVVKNYHGTYWHVTSDPNFKIDPHYIPREGSSMGMGEGGPSEGPGALEVTVDPQNWGAVFEGTRKYIARIELGDAKPGVDFQDTTRGFGHEIWVNNIDKAKVTKVYPWKQGIAANRRLYEGGGLPQSEEELRAIWERAHPEEETTVSVEAITGHAPDPEVRQWVEGQSNSVLNPPPLTPKERFFNPKRFGVINESLDPLAREKRIGTTTQHYQEWALSLPKTQLKALDDWRGWQFFPKIQSLLRQQPIPGAPTATPLAQQGPSAGVTPVVPGDVPVLHPNHRQVRHGDRFGSSDT